MKATLTSRRECTQKFRGARACGRGPEAPLRSASLNVRDPEHAALIEGYGLVRNPAAGGCNCCLMLSHALGFFLHGVCAPAGAQSHPCHEPGFQSLAKLLYSKHPDPPLGRVKCRVPLISPSVRAIMISMASGKRLLNLTQQRDVRSSHACDEGTSCKGEVRRLCGCFQSHKNVAQPKELQQRRPRCFLTRISHSPYLCTRRT